MSRHWNPPKAKLGTGSKVFESNGVDDLTKAIATRFVVEDTDMEVTSPLVSPIYHSSTYIIKDLQQYQDILTKGGSIYSRLSNYTCQSAECSINAMEDGAGSLVFGSGMAAVTTTLLTFLNAGDHVIACNPFYSGSYAFIKNYLPKYKIEVTFVPFEIEAYKKAIRPNTKMLYTETPLNPTVRVIDLKKFVELSKVRSGIVTVVDSTFGSPYLQKPITLGVDIVVHSATKYLGGHSDLCGGAVTTRTLEQWKSLNVSRMEFGGVMSPHDASLLLRGIKTLPLRMEKISDNAEKIAAYLEQHPNIASVSYPGLKSHPDHDIAKQQMTRFGGMISFSVKSGLPGARYLIEHLKLVHLAVSLGGVESLIAHPASMTHGPMLMTDEDRRQCGIDEGTLRLSVGIESAKDLIEDLQQALDGTPE